MFLEVPVLTKNLKIVNNFLCLFFSRFHEIIAHIKAIWDRLPAPSPKSECYICNFIHVSELLGGIF